jgi:autotransporter-associated beta strand protein
MTINLHLPAHIGSRLAVLGKAVAFVASVVCLLTSTPLRAQTTLLYWDINGATAGSSGTTLAAGTWDQGTNNFWSTNSGGTVATQLWSAAAGDKIATFSAGNNATGTFTVTVNGTVNNVAGITFEEGAVTLGGTGTLSLTGTPTLNVASSSATISAILTGTVGLSKTGAGTLTLSGANTYTGATNINAGILSAQSAGALGTSSNTANTTVASGATLQLANGITTTNGGTLVLNGTGAGSGALRSVSGNNAWNSNVTLASNATIFSATAGSQLTIGNSSATNSFAMGSNTVTIDGPGDTYFYSDAGVSGDTGGLTKNGTGTLTLYGYNTYYTGATAVNAGSLELVVGPFSAGLYGINGPLTIGAGSTNPALAGTVKVDIWTNSFANQISPTSAVTINSDGILNVGAATSLGSLTLNGGQVNTTSGITLNPTGTITANTNSAHQTSLISGGVLSLSTGNVNVARDSTLASDLTISSVIAGTGSLTKTGGGILTLSGANTYTGGTNINAGTLRLGASERIANNTAVTIASGATLNLNNFTETIGALSGAGTVQLGSGTLTVGSGDASSTFSGAFAAGDTGTLAKTGTGTLTFGSGMDLSAGTLQLGGGTLNLGGFTSTFGALSVTASSFLDFGASGSSILRILNSVTVSSGVILTIQNWTDSVDYFYSMLSPSVASLGRINFAVPPVSGARWQSFDNQIVPVPETSVYGAVFLGLSALFAAWRLHRRTS